MTPPPARRSFLDYRRFIQGHYDGLPGALTSVTGLLTGHEALGGRLLLLTTEDNFTGRWCSRLWHCRTYRRPELREVSAECGLRWGREMFFSRLHARLGIGGIIVELHREPPTP